MSGTSGPERDRDPIEDFRDLNDPARRREIERRGDFFVVEGLLALESLLASHYPIRSLLVAEPKEQVVRRLVGDRASLTVRPEREVAAITGFNFHRGVLATAGRVEPVPLAELASTARRLLLTEGVNDHENLGSLFRNAAAFGADGVVLDPTTADPLYRRTVRVSMGHVLLTPWARLKDPAAAALTDLSRQGFTVVALTPAPEAEPIDSLADTPPERMVITVGAEGPGLSPDALAAADRKVRIPIASGVDSLNVATTAAIALHRLLPPPGP